jgi:hypothetical protein
MERAHDMQNEAVKGVPRDWGQLIRKLRWIGLEDEACRLQVNLPPDQKWHCVSRAIQH